MFFRDDQFHNTSSVTYGTAPPPLQVWTSDGAAIPINDHRSMNLITALAAIQCLGIDFLPLEWEPESQSLGLGGTAIIRQSPLDVQTILAFKVFRDAKVIEQRDPKIQAQDIDRALRVFMHEIMILTLPELRDDPHTAHLIGVCFQVMPSGRIWPAIVMEKSRLGDLKHLVEAGDAGSFRERLHFCTQIASLLVRLHSNYIIHGDIKPENILVDTDSDGKPTPKITDFGYSAKFDSDIREKVQLPRSEPWHAPELDLNTPVTCEQAQSMDIYSFALVCLWLLFYNESYISANPTKINRATIVQLRGKGRDMKCIAIQCLGRISNVIDSWQRRHLEEFFALSLSSNPSDRPLGLLKLAALEAGAGSPSGIHDSPQTHRCDIGIALGKNYREIPLEFSIARSLHQLLHMDLRIQASIVESLRTAHLDSEDEALSRSAAFQLAICTLLGFNVLHSREEALRLLSLSGRSNSEFDSQIDFIRQDRLSYKSYIFNGFEKSGVIISEDARTPVSKAVSTEAYLTYKRQGVALQAILGTRHESVLYLRNSLAQACFELRRYEEAETVRYELSEQWKEILGAGFQQDPAWIHAQGNLALAISAQPGREKDSEQILFNVLRAQDGQTVKDRLFLARTFGNLGILYEEQGNLQLASEFYRRTLADMQGTLGDHHEYTLVTVHRLLATLLDLGKSSDALEILETLEPQFIHEFGLWDNRTLGLAMTAARLHKNSGAYNRAISMYERILARPSGILGPRFTLEPVASSELASLYFMTGMISDAETIVSKINDLVEIDRLGGHAMSLEALLGAMPSHYSENGPCSTLRLSTKIAELIDDRAEPNHQYKLRALGNLAFQYLQLGSYDMACNLFQKITLDGSNDDHVPASIVSWKMKSKRMLGVVYQKQGRVFDAQRVWKEIEEQYEQLPDVCDQTYIKTLRCQGSLCASLSRHDEAIQYMLRSLEAAKSCYGPQNQECLLIMVDIAHQYIHLKNVHRAKEIYSEIKLNTAQEEWEDLDILVLKHNYAELGRQLGFLEDALNTLRAVSQAFESRLGYGSLEVITSKNNIAGVLYKLGRTEECRALLEPLLATASGSLGTKHQQTLLIEARLKPLLKKDGVFKRFLETQKLRLGVGKWKRKATASGP